MAEYDFTLKFRVPDEAGDREAISAQLYDGGCDDALIGIGKPGRILLDFTREAGSCLDAMNSAIRDVLAVVPSATLIEAEPDLVGLTDVADLVDCSRQYVRKVAMNDATFPTPVHSGTADLFHLVEVLDWMASSGRIRAKEDVDVGRLHEVSQVSRTINVNHQLQRLPDRALLARVQVACDA